MSAIGALLFLIVHAHLRENSGRKPRACERPPPEFPARLRRKFLSAFAGTISGARLFHLIMAMAMLALLFTAFLPKVGVEFPWVTYHWIAGIVLTISVIYHIFHATSGWISGRSGLTRKTSRTLDGE